MDKNEVRIPSSEPTMPPNLFIFSGNRFPHCWDCSTKKSYSPNIHVSVTSM
ncbi:hypothetical protein HCJ39_13415 [Listeria rocourtiae]|uniref:hypothetical protein n=1 Tax=Listeria rocourtiae TaxID=647910 RepID=UPI001624B3CD|nr:hypothetical protein [Listeria rocourtiae]MBC1605712.1 hypothetical protein [Listeria rocourtiae]